ncbi:elongation factor EF-2 [Candidatus Woesearchaeota archaeon]|nr:elongation factor EF-2 [Candidatus Woesearchaeota archaeon]
MAAEESKLEKMKRLANSQATIRNIATSAHIHHGKCVSPNTRLFLTDGTVMTAEELYNKSVLFGSKVRDNKAETVYEVSNNYFEVFSLNKETGRIEKKKLSHAWKLVGGNTIKARLRNGAEITTTSEHKYIVLEDMDFVEKEANELKLGDRLVCARKIDIEEKADIKKEILSKLSNCSCYAVLKNEFGKKLKLSVLGKGIKNILKLISSEDKHKSFYHGVWQNRYKINDLIKLAQLFDLSSDELYENIDKISFRNNTKSTKEINLPNNFEELFYLTGLFFGDGSHKKFIVGKEELKDEFISICERLGIKAKYVVNKHRTPELITNNSLAHLLNVLFDYPLKQKSHNIRINNFVFSAKKEFVAQFIKGYFDCDGTVEESRRAVSVTSVSKQMLKDLQLLLLRFNCLSIVNDDTLYITGISARNYAKEINFKVEHKKEKTEKLIKRTQGSIVTDTIPLSNNKLVSVRKVSSASIDHHYYKYEKQILTPTFDTVLQLKQKFSDLNQQTNLFDRLTTGDLAFIEIASLEQKYEPVVYDFSVPDFKNFVAEGIVIHNTALTDNLLAAAGLMNEDLAGSLEGGMATWAQGVYKRIQQDRIMTIDAANVSMVHTCNDQEFLINLIDTPGHIDFGGNVTRAMRAVDGTIVLVCASEGVMPQTETVLRQALRERVKPVLFINKVDRLINELLMSPEQIQKRLGEIIVNFNELIEKIAEPEFKQKWKVNAADGSVAFGSARENWALSVPYMQKHGVSFKDIIAIYKVSEKERQDWVWKHAPLFEVILDMVVKHCPSPLDAQKYRIPKIWKGETESELGQDLLKCNPQGKVAFMVTRVMVDPKTNREVVSGRLYSGTIREGTTLYFNNLKTTQRIGQIVMFLGTKTEIVEQLGSGNIFGLVGITAGAGDTVTENPEQPFEELKHIFEPVITKSIAPVKPQDISKIVEVLKKILREDPSIKVEINEETGEILVHGLGELQLEVIESRIKEEEKIAVKTGEPIVTYRETVLKTSPEAEGKSPNKHNKLYFVVEPLEPHIRELIKNGDISEGRIKKKDLMMRDTLVDAGWDSDAAFSIKDIYKGNMFIDETKGNVQLSESIQLVIEGFEQVIDNGPLAKEPCFGLKITLKDAKLHEDAIHRGPAQMYPAVRDGIREAMVNGSPCMFEPVQTKLVEGPEECTGDITKLVMNKRGSIIDMQHENNMCIVKAKLPVAEMIGWESALRSATGGRGFSSLVDQNFEKVPGELQSLVITQIRTRKGIVVG